MNKLTRYENFKPTGRRILEAEELDPAEPMNIKWVADITDESTLSVMKYIWTNMTESQRVAKLKGMNKPARLVEKLSSTSFEDLSDDDKREIVTGFHRVDVQKELE
jgi:hypothetical protein